MKRSVLIALGIATLVKLVLAWFTIGTNDVETWRAFAYNARLCRECVYQLAGPYGDPFNHPPFIIHFLRLISGAQETFPFWLRLPAILADAGSVFLIARMLSSISTPILVLLAVNPVSIFISGFHGNTDPVMIFFVLLSVYLLNGKRLGWAAAAFGMAINIKVVPLLLVPSILSYLWSKQSWKAAVIFASIAAAVVLLTSMPYVFSEPLTILKATLGYGGMYGKWGTARVLIALSLSPSGHEVAARIMQVVIIVVTFATALWLNWRKTDLFVQIGLTFFLFFLLTPALAVQYLAWPVPFVLALGFWWAFVYYASAALYLFLTYNYWSNGQWYFADSHLEPQWTVASYMAGFLCWAVCAFICLRYKHILARSRNV
jgi:hypothetical protein